MGEGVQVVGKPRSGGRRVRLGASSASWQRRLRRTVVAVDAAVVLAAVTSAALLGTHRSTSPWAPDTTAVLAATVVVLVAFSLAAFRAWDPATLGAGADEFNRIYRAIVFSLLVLGLGGYAVLSTSVRPWAFGVLPAIGLALAGARLAIRRALHRARRARTCLSSVLVVGSDESVADLVVRLRRVPHHGWDVVAACTSTGGATGAPDVVGVPVVGDLDAVTEHARRVDLVAVAPAPGWSPRRLHRLAWELEGTGVELVVDPGLMEIGGPRLRVAPVDGLPLLRLTQPRFSGAARIIKGVTDRATALALLVLLTPVLVVLGLLVAADGGPVLYRQDRVGLKGRRFRMIKFRSMVVDAEHRREALGGSDGHGPLFKLRTDPRVTRVGAFLRRYSLDELPQLVNVLTGSMSLVGPRPPLPGEVETYADDARRRLLVRPGITGLWQVSGRSDLSWEESVRLDLRYVENWSPALDVLILAKTVGAVLFGRGAY